MVVLVNRAKMTTNTTGTGTITLGSATSGFQTFAAAGVSNGNSVRYCLQHLRLGRVLALLRVQRLVALLLKAVIVITP